MNLKLLNRAIANAGPMSDIQRRAMWAKRRIPSSSVPPRAQAGDPAARNPVQKPAPGLGKPSVPPYIPPGQPGGRPWGESRPGEMYPAVEGPGNPSWERRHPERAPGGLPADRPRGYTPPIIPTPPAATPGVQYPGGSPRFDERTGTYVPSIPAMRPGAQAPEHVIGWDPRGQPIYDPTIPHIPEDPRFRPIRPGDTPAPPRTPPVAPPPPVKQPPAAVPIQTQADRIAERESRNDPIPRQIRAYLALREKTRRAIR